MSREELLECLRNAGGFISGEELSVHFSVSRTAVWKSIKALTDAGYKIEAVRNRGYRLVSEPDRLTADRCRAEFDTRWAGRSLEVYDEIDSTNRRCKELGEQGAPQGTLVVSDYQSAGRGRRGRTWLTPPGTALAFTLLLRPRTAVDRVSQLTLTAAMAVRSAVTELTGADAQIKWPNDVVIERKKICGILTEMSTDLDQIQYVVVGIGVNVTVKDFPEELSDRATSLLLATGLTVSRSKLLARIMHYMEQYYEDFEKTGDLSLLREDYEAHMAGIDGPVVIEDSEGSRPATCLGIADNGAMCVRYPDGREEKIISGEVSVRGIYGYI